MARRTRRLWTDEEKRSICFQTTAPGVSVAQVSGRDPGDRLAARREHSAPIISALKPLLETQLSRIPQKFLLAEDIR
jgi:hypothetical protein